MRFIYKRVDRDRRYINKAYKKKFHTQKNGGKSQQRLGNNNNAGVLSKVLLIDMVGVGWESERQRQSRRDMSWIEWIIRFHKTVDADKQHLYLY